MTPIHFFIMYGIDCAHTDDNEITIYLDNYNNIPFDELHTGLGYLYGDTLYVSNY